MACDRPACVPPIGKLEWPKVILFGDSITQQSFNQTCPWGAFLAEQLQRVCDVVNRGLSGYTTRWNRMLLPHVIDSSMAENVAAFVIFLGANDSNRQDANPKQHVPLEEYKENLVEMVQFLLDIGLDRRKIILIGPPPCDESAWAAICKEQGKSFGKSDKLAMDYSETCGKAASQCGVEFLDVYSAMKQNEDWKKYFHDGLHFSTEGSNFFRDLLWPLIQKRTDHLPNMFPMHYDIDVNDLPHTLMLEKK